MLKVPQKRRKIGLKEKIELIEYHKANKISVQKLAERFKISRTQTGAILKNKEKLMDLWLSNKTLERSRLPPDSIGYQIDKHVYEWYKYMHDGDIQVTGPMIQSKSREIAAEMGNQNFKASNGWLANFLKRHKIFLKPTKADDTDTKEGSERLEKWRKHVAAVVVNYSPGDVFTADEVGLFFNAFPERTKTWKNETCADGKKLSLRRMTILLCTSMTGVKEKPLLIFRDSRLKNFNPSELEKFPVTWRTNNFSWMTRNIMAEWLKALDEKLVNQKRKIVLFMDNAPSHSEHKLKNVKIELFPPDISLYEQPMLNGITQNFKTFYRQKLLNFVLSNQNQKYKPTSESIDIPEAVDWISGAWANVSSNFIQNCFKNTSFSYNDSKVTKLNNNALYINEVSLLLEKYGCTVKPTDYINIDSNIETEGSDPTSVEVLVDSHEFTYDDSETEDMDESLNENESIKDHGAIEEEFDFNKEWFDGTNSNTRHRNVEENLQDQNESDDEGFSKKDMVDEESSEPDDANANLELSIEEIDEEFHGNERSKNEHVDHNTSENNSEVLVSEESCHSGNSKSVSYVAKIDNSSNSVTIVTGNAMRVESYSQALFRLKDLEEFYRSVMDFECLSEIHRLITHNQKVVNSNKFYKTGY